MSLNAERVRLEETGRREKHWRRWGPYLSERAWGTVREDYSATGEAWDFFPHDQARSRVYRWTEDGIAGICDNHQRLCFAPAFWNGRDPILKERLFGLNGHEGNHGEDVKEYYYYLDSTPTHSYMKCLYKYPQAEFPYSWLVDENGRRGREQPEFELIDTGVFAENRYFDIFTEYSKADTDDILIRITVVNRSADRATLHVLPTLWFRNTWSWMVGATRPSIREIEPCGGNSVIEASESTMGTYHLSFDERPPLLFTENETNTERLWNFRGDNIYYKDAFHERVIRGREAAVNPAATGTKACAWYLLDLAPLETRVLRLRLTAQTDSTRLVRDFDGIFNERIEEADTFYSFCPEALSEDGRGVQRQALAGLLWTKQYYHFVVEDWLRGDPTMPTPPASRLDGRDHEWVHLFNEDVISMPDKWEYPWYAAWDLAFHTIPLAMIDPEYAKSLLGVFLREWYMHPNGQLPAYEWAFGDVNPPVHAWACWRVYKIDGKVRAARDFDFLESAFHKLLMNFTWWVNRKDSEGNNIFEGGFLGLDNIGIFDRSKPLPTGGILEQSDGTSWMAMYCLNMLKIAMELATVDRIYEDVASKFFEHFLYIASAMNNLGDGQAGGLWDDEDGFFYDRLRLPDGQTQRMKIRSLVGLIPLFAVDTIEPDDVSRLAGFKRRMGWFVAHRPDLCRNIASMTRQGLEERRLLSIMQRPQLARVLQRMFDETEFLSPFGIRSLSKYHEQHPFVLAVNGTEHRIDYEPAESHTSLFGGNSNWRGPVWFPVNFLIIESLQKYHHYYGDDFQVECPTGSGQKMNLWNAASELSRRLSRLFLRDANGRRPVFGACQRFQQDPNFRDYVPFHEFFHGDNGAGLGASHQTGWTALVAKLLQQSGE
jgi:Mannosylglycerate hydrolase MGH1-like glycoside hydrolase domain/Glycosyl hydrolase family 63 C-terminal domain